MAFYDKKRIVMIFERYCEDGKDETFMQLITECEPLFDVLLKKYPTFAHCRDDIKQELRIKMLENLRRPQVLKKELISPTTFLYRRLWMYLYFCLRRYSKIFGIPLILSSEERHIVQLHDVEGRGFEEIAELLGLEEGATYVLYRVARCKADRAMMTFTDREMDVLMLSQNTFLDPAKQYEAKSARIVWHKELVRQLKKRVGYTEAQMEATLRHLEQLLRENGEVEDG